MNKRVPFVLLFLALLLSGVELFAQTRIRDVYAAAPDSIFPLLTKNNRLDQIDFRENNMQAVVKNRFDGHSELLILNDRYLRMRLSERSVVEMRLITDSTFCMVQTYNGPVADSRVRLFDIQWNELPCAIERPSVDEFLDENVDMDVRLALQALPLIKASLSEENDFITWQLQTGELTKEQRQKAEGKVREINRLLSQPE